MKGTKVSLFYLDDLKIEAYRSIFVWSLLFWVFVTFVALSVMGLPFGISILGGFISMLLHWVSALAHQLGHARAARQTGYPMVGVDLWFLLGTSIYPDDEPELPAEVHIKRALGGIPISLFLGLTGVILSVVLRTNPGLAYIVVVFFTVENLLVFTIGAIMPLNFTDGGTLREWLPKREKLSE